MMAIGSKPRIQTALLVFGLGALSVAPLAGAGVAKVGAQDHASSEHDAHHSAELNYVELSGSFVNFAIWLAILVFGARAPLSEMLRNRRASVVEGMEEAKRVKEEAEAKYKEYSERIENLDAELERLREEMRRAGMEERDRIVADASKRAEKMRAEARFLIEQQMKDLRVELTREAVEAAVAAAEESLRKATSQQDQERLAQEYLGTIKSALQQQVGERQL